MFAFGRRRVKTLFKTHGENFVFYPYGLMRKGILVTPQQKEEIEEIFLEHFSPPLIYRVIRTVFIGGILIVNLFIFVAIVSDFYVPVHFNMIFLLACVVVLVALATRPYRRDLARVIRRLPRTTARLTMAETIARDARTMSNPRVLLLSLASGAIAASVVYYYLRPEARLGGADTLIYLMLFGLFAGLSAYYAAVWIRKIAGSVDGGA